MENLFSLGDFTLANPRLHLVEAAAQKASQDREQRILDEIANPPAGLLGKKVWQMTREAWESIHSPINKAYAISISFGIEAGNAFLKLHGYTHNGYEFKPETPSNGRHEVQVAYALLRGDSVPAEVLAQYPQIYWERSDLRGFRYMPMYITTRSECLVAIAEWEKMSVQTKGTLDAKYFNHQSERDLNFHLNAYERIWKELLMLMDTMSTESLGRTCRDCAKKVLRKGQRVIGYEDEAGQHNDFIGTVIEYNFTTEKVVVRSEFTGELVDCTPRELEIIG